MTRRKSLLYKAYTPYLLSGPALLIMILFLILPMFFAIALSFTDASLLSYAAGKYTTVGVKNYITFLTSPSFPKVLSSTFVYVVLGVTLTFLVGLGTALLLNMKLRASFFFRGALILPWIIPQVVLVLIWKWMLNPRYGVVNQLLSSLGVIDANFSWFTAPGIAIFVLMLVTVWKQYPLACLILLAGLKGIPEDTYEAARIDGANVFQRFWYITLPGLRYVSKVLIMLLTIWSFTNFTIIWVLTKGGPADSTATISIFTYLNAFQFNKLGYGAAVGVVGLLITLAFSVVYYLIAMRKSEVE